jgi:hypothetical protein
MDDILYRRGKYVLAPDWHFSERCPNWPVKDFVQTSLVDPEQGDRICPICISLELEGSNGETECG